MDTSFAAICNCETGQEKLILQSFFMALMHERTSLRILYQCGGRNIPASPRKVSRLLDFMRHRLECASRRISSLKYNQHLSFEEDGTKIYLFRCTLVLKEIEGEDLAEPSITIGINVEIITPTTSNSVPFVKYVEFFRPEEVSEEFFTRLFAKNEDCKYNYKRKYNF